MYIGGFWLEAGAGADACAGGLHKYLAEARFAAATWRGRCEDLEGLTDDEREEVTQAVVLAGLRFSNYYNATRRSRGMTTVVLTLAFYALTWLVEEAVAIFTLHRYVPVPQLVVALWAGAAAGWLVGSYGYEEVRTFLAALVRRPSVRLIVLSQFVELGLVGFVYVIGLAVNAVVVSDERAVLQLSAAVLGSLGGLFAPRINRVARDIAHRIVGLRNGRVRSQDDLLTDLVYVAHETARALHGRGSASWRHRSAKRAIAELLGRTARNIERAPGLARSLHWWQFRLRAGAAEPYAAVAAIVRLHREKVFAAGDIEQWRRISSSLACGAFAAARHDWPSLVEFAPNSRLGARANPLRLAARRLGTPLLLVACAFALPRLFDLGAYGASLRSILAVSAALALLPTKSDAAGLIRDSFAKTQSWRS